ncbi:hypothetical protein BJ085DRAFT_10636, partial [Dimargaris cristalligena]
FDWSEEIILVTGGAGGIGQLLVDTLAIQNATVVSLDIVEPDCGLWGNVHFYQCDLNDPQQIDTTYQQLVEEVGHPTIIINNAGVVHPKTVLEQSTANVAKILQINTLAPIQLVRLALPALLEARRGHIVNVSSVLGYVSPCRVSAYAASKAALAAYTDSLRQELRHKLDGGQDIHVTLVAPGLVSTKLFAGVELDPFLSPAVETLDVVQAIVKAIASESDHQIKLPFYAVVAPFMVGFPLCLKRVMHFVAGSNHAL